MSKRGGRGGGGGMHQIHGGGGRDDRGSGGGRGGGGRGGGGGGGGGRGGGGRSKTNVGYLNPEAPSFIQKLRAQHGLQSREESHATALTHKRRNEGPDGATIVTPDDLDTRPVLPDEAPQVVVLKKKHLSLDEVKAFMESGAQGLEGVLEGVLESDAKRARTDASGEAATDSDPSAVAAGSAPAPSKTGAADAKAEKKKKKKDKAVAPGALSKNLDKRNTKMLSFGDDEDAW